METNNQKNDQNIIPNDADKQQKGVNVPNLRFSEFNGDWIKSRLSNYLVVSSLRNKNNTFTRNDVLSVSGDLGCVNQIQLLGRSFAGVSLIPYHIVEFGDIVYTKSPLSEYPYGIIKTNRYQTGIVSTLYAVYKTNKNANNRFIEHYFGLKSRINNYLKPIVKIGAKHDMKVGNEEVLSNYVCFPDVIEQVKIANFIDLLDQRIDTQNKIIEKYESLISTIRTNIFSSFQGKWTKLCDLVENKSLQLNRGNIIPKHPKDDIYKYPVYSSSVQKDGLMGYSDYYMFDKELITWSIDGGGDIFFREKHKFCVTNVCGILQLDTNKFSYRFVAEALKYQHSKMTFDYQTKAHPSVIEKLYALPDIELNEQDKYSKLFEVLYSKLGNERKYLEIIKEQKKYLLLNMFI